MCKNVIGVFEKVTRAGLKQLPFLGALASLKPLTLKVEVERAH